MLCIFLKNCIFFITLPPQFLVPLSLPPNPKERKRRKGKGRERKLHHTFSDTAASTWDFFPSLPFSSSLSEMTVKVAEGLLRILQSPTITKLCYTSCVQSFKNKGHILLNFIPLLCSIILNIY